MDSNVFKIVGDPLSAKYISQIIKINGKAGDEFILTGWAMADAVPLSGERKFGLKLIFKNGTTVVGEAYEEFNTAISGKDWQFTACYANAPAAYDSITVQVLYNYAANTAYFDGIQLLKERFGSTYTYEDGNVKTATDEEGNVTQYTYVDNDLTTVVHPDNKTTTYTYDNYHNVLTATTPEGVVYTYTYDKYGNNTSVSIGGGTTKITSTATYSANGNILLSTKDALDKETTYGYNVDTNVLEWVRYPSDTVTTQTEYTYDSMFRLDTAEKANSTEYSLLADYTYANDYLTAIQTRSTTYSFTYGAFGLRESIKIGSWTLATYAYTAQDHDLSVLTYGNGDRVTYTYDDYGRVILETYEDGSTIAYAYDNDGALATVTDSESGIKTTYYYDFTSRLMQYIESGAGYSHSVGYVYDSDNNSITNMVERINGVEYETEHIYDEDNRIEDTTISTANDENITIGYTYDSFGRLTNTLTRYGTHEFISKDYFFKAPSTGRTSTQIINYQVDTPGYIVNYDITYDSNGNITSVEVGSTYLSYEYDSANQLVRENNSAAERSWVWTYDSAGNILIYNVQ
jgi:YD repeat-containing protein